MSIGICISFLGLPKKVPQTTEIYSLTSWRLKAEKCWQYWFLLEALGDNLFMYLF